MLLSAVWVESEEFPRDAGTAGVAPAA